MKKAAAVLVVGATVAVACSNSALPDGAGSAVPDDNGQVVTSVDPPTHLEAELMGDDADTVLAVVFRPSPGAEAHLLDFGDGVAAVRVEPEDCSREECTISLDRHSVASASSLSAAAVVGEGQSESTNTVELPEWPEPTPPSEAAEGEAQTLVIARAAESQPIVIETEDLSAGADVEARILELESEADVVGVEVDGPAVELQGESGAEAGPRDHPDGLVTWQQEALDFARLPPEPRGVGVTIAVIDSGVNTDHPVFSSAGGTADITTINVVDPGADVVPGHHGTSVASLIVGQPGSRIPGIADGATIRAYDANGNGGGEYERSDLAKAIVAAVSDGADVINISIAIPCRYQVGPIHHDCEPGAVRAAVEYAEAEGVVVVAGAGNDGDGCTDSWRIGPNEDQWPAKFPTVLAVGGVNRGGETWRCSPDKDYIDVLAPSSTLRIARLPDGFEVGAGTSFAAPLVSGLVAIILAEQPDLTPAEVRAMLTRATAENGRLIPGVIMADLGLVPEGPIVDPTSVREVYPYTLELKFRPGHPVQVAARAVEDSWMIPDLDHTGEVLGLGPGVWGPINHDTVVHLTIVGTIFVEDDGSLTGYGVMEGIGPENDHGYSTGGEATSADPVGHRVYCPAPMGVTPRPHIAFNWLVPASVGGQLNQEEYRADIDLSLALGQGAAPDEAGELPGVTIIHDDLRDCPGLLSTVWDDIPRTMWPGSQLCDLDAGPDACWPVVERARDDLVDLTEALYREIIGIGPLQFVGDVSSILYGPSSISLGSIDDEWDATLSIGV